MYFLFEQWEHFNYIDFNYWLDDNEDGIAVGLQQYRYIHENHMNSNNECTIENNTDK